MIQMLSFVTASLLAFVQSGTHRDVQPVRIPRAWVVDVAGSGDFLDLPAAVQAVSPGDLLEVRTGFYSAFELVGKPLTIQGGLATFVSGETVVRDVQQGAVVLRSLQFRAGAPSLSLRDCSATLWLEDCDVRPVGGDRCMEVVSCSAVVLSRVLVHSWQTLDFDARSFSADLSTIHAFRCFFEGASAGNFLVTGGTAAFVHDSFLYAAGCAFQGGRGWRGCQSGCTNPTAGGDGIVVCGASDVRSLASHFKGGVAGEPGSIPGLCNCPGNPPDGEPIVGTVEIIPLPERAYSIGSPAQVGGTYRLSAEGEPGELLWSSISSTPAATYVPQYFGPQLVAYPITFVAEGTIPAGGLLEKDVAVPPIPGLAFEEFFFQGLFFDALGNAYLGGGSFLVVLP